MKSRKKQVKNAVRKKQENIELEYLKNPQNKKARKKYASKLTSELSPEYQNQLKWLLENA